MHLHKKGAHKQTHKTHKRCYCEHSDCVLQKKRARKNMAYVNWAEKHDWNLLKRREKIFEENKRNGFFRMDTYICNKMHAATYQA